MRFLFVDRIIQSSPGEYIKGMKHVTSDDAYLNVDEQGRSYFISSLIGETLGQLAAWNVMAHNQFTLRPVAGVVSSARMCRPAYAGETILLESFIDVLDDSAVEYHGIARVGNEPVFILEGALGPLLPMSDFIEAQEVQQQYDEINRPGDWARLSELAMLPNHVAANMTFNNSIHSLPQSLMTFDRVLEIMPGESLRAEKKITRSASYFPDHFPKKPVLPMTVLLECIQHLAQQFISAAPFDEEYTLCELRKIKMNDFVQPGDVVVCHLKLKYRTQDELVLTSRSEVEGKRVCVVEVVLNTKGN